jgi:hypothetical protein
MVITRRVFIRAPPYRLVFGQRRLRDASGGSVIVFAMPRCQPK